MRRSSTSGAHLPRGCWYYMKYRPIRARATSNCVIQPNDYRPNPKTPTSRRGRRTKRLGSMIEEASAGAGGFDGDSLLLAGTSFARCPGRPAVDTRGGTRIESRLHGGGGGGVREPDAPARIAGTAAEPARGGWATEVSRRDLHGLLDLPVLWRGRPGSKDSPTGSTPC